MRFALSVAFLMAFGGVVGKLPDARGGSYSRHATSIWGKAGGLTISSPDLKKVIQTRAPSDGSDYPLIVVTTNGRTYNTALGSWVDAEVAWSPDSKAFFVTYSDGGNVGTFHVKVVYIDSTGLRIIEPVPNGRLLFVPRCFDPEVPNVGAIKWTGNGSSGLLIAVEVPPHSSCASSGTFRAFDISLPNGRVFAHYDQIAAKRLFSSDLGEELRAAEDGCILHPATCMPSGMDKHE